MIQARQANESDIGVLNDLRGHYHGRKEQGYWQHCLSDDWREIFIVTMDGADVGYGMLNWKPRYFLFKNLGIPEIQDLYVIETARQQGVASFMIAYCENHASKKKCEYIGIGVGLHKAFGPAQRLYVKMGYMPDGYGIVYDREPVNKDDRLPVDDDLNLMMIKQLDL